MVVMVHCEVVMVEMVCLEEMVRMESQDLKENRDHLDLAQGPQGSRSAGVTYIRWEKNSCPIV